MIKDLALRWEVLDGAGWEYVLPLAGRRRWLCIDATRGATSLLIAGLCEELQIVPARRDDCAEIVSRIHAEAIGHAWVAAGGEIPLATRDGSPFDGFVLHDLRGILGKEAIEQALEVAARSVKPEGFIYVALRNRLGYTRLRRGLSDLLSLESRAYFAPGFVRRLLGETRRVLSYPLVNTAQGHILNVVPERGWISAKNPSIAAELLRQGILGPRGALFLSPSFALLATGDPASSSELSRALATLVAHGFLKDREDRESLIKRYHVLNGGKAIISVGGESGKYGTHIVVLARASLVIARRRHESRMLSLLGNLPAGIASRIPRFHYEDHAGAAHVFVLQEFPGITYDRPTPRLRTATRNAATFLVKFHRATRRTVDMTPERFQALLARLFDIARTRYPMLTGSLDRLEDGMREELIGQSMPLVWMHGDFKIENIVVDERHSRLLGVIDWEHSEPEGLPLLDLGYLFVYNRQITAGTDFFAAARDTLSPGGLAATEASLLAEYLAALRIPPRIVPALHGALIVHHCAIRMEYNPADAQAMRCLRELLDLALTWLDRPSSRREGGAERRAARDA